MSLLCNDSITMDKKEIGDPTEVALTNLGEEYGMDELVVREEYPRTGEIPFDSDRKLMSTVNKIDGRYIMITKGALDVLLSRVSKMDTSQGLVEFTDQQRKEIEQINRTFSTEGLRVLCFAYKEVREGQEIHTDDENDLIFVGLTAMMDLQGQNQRVPLNLVFVPESSQS